MQAIKYILVAVVAVCATQAAEIPISADKVDLRLFVENGAAIARILFNTVNTGLDQSKPYADKILNELAPEARTLIRKVIDETRAKIREEDKRVTQIFDTLTKALNTLKPIKVCSDKVSPEAKKLALATERNITKTIQEIQKKYKKEIDNIKIATERTIQRARTLFDTEVDAVVKCLTPGRKDADACLNKEIDKILSGISTIAADIIMIINTANETLSPIGTELVEKLLPVMTNTLADGRVILKTLTQCVSAMK